MIDKNVFDGAEIQSEYVIDRLVSNTDLKSIDEQDQLLLITNPMHKNYNLKIISKIYYHQLSYRVKYSKLS